MMDEKNAYAYTELQKQTRAKAKARREASKQIKALAEKKEKVISNIRYIIPHIFLSLFGIQFFLPYCISLVIETCALPIYRHVWLLRRLLSKIPERRLLHEDALIVQNMGR